VSIDRRPTRGLSRGLRAIPVLLTLLIVAVAPAAAQQESIDSPYRWRESGFRIGLWGAYHAANRGNLEYGQGPTPAFGVKSRVRVSAPLNLELGATYGPAKRWVVDPRVETGPAIVDTVSSGWLRLDVGVQVALTGNRTWHGILPYGLIGGGWAFGIDEGGSAVFADPALEPFRYRIGGGAPHVYLGTGFEVFPSEKIGIGFEIRDHLLRQKVPNGFLSSSVLDLIEDTGAPAPGTAWPMNFEFGVVIWYYF
jgi:hypothetical protein